MYKTYWYRIKNVKVLSANNYKTRTINETILRPHALTTKLHDNDTMEDVLQSPIARPTRFTSERTIPKYYIIDNRGTHDIEWLLVSKCRIRCAPRLVSCPTDHDKVSIDIAIRNSRTFTTSAYSGFYTALANKPVNYASTSAHIV